MDVSESAIWLVEAYNTRFGVWVDCGGLADQVGSRPIFGVLGDAVADKLFFHEFCSGLA